MTKKKVAGILICIAIALLGMLLLLMQKHSSDSDKQPADKGSYSYLLRRAGRCQCGVHHGGG